MGTGLGIGKCIVMMSQVEATGVRYRLQLKIGQDPAEMASRGSKGISEHIVGVIHTVDPENLFQAPLVKSTVVGHKRKTFNKRFYLFPDPGKYRRILSILSTQPVHLPAKPLIILRLRMNQAVERVHNLTAAHNHHPNAAHAGTALIRRLKIYCCKVFQALTLIMAAQSIHNWKLPQR